MSTRGHVVAVTCLALGATIALAPWVAVIGDDRSKIVASLGTADVIAVLRSPARQPSQLPALARTALDARGAAAALRRGRRLLGAGLAFPYFEELALDAKLAVEMT